MIIAPYFQSSVLLHNPNGLFRLASKSWMNDMTNGFI